VHGELADDGLAGAGGGGDQDALPRLQRPTGLRLEVVQREAVAGGEIGRTEEAARRRAGKYRSAGDDMRSGYVR